MLSLNMTFLYFFKRFPAMILPNKGDKKSMTSVGIKAPPVRYNTKTVKIMNNSVKTISVAPYLNKRELCVVSIVLNSFLYIRKINFYLYIIFLI